MSNVVAEKSFKKGVDSVAKETSSPVSLTSRPPSSSRRRSRKSLLPRNTSPFTDCAWRWCPPNRRPRSSFAKARWRPSSTTPTFSTISPACTCAWDEGTALIPSCSGVCSSIPVTAESRGPAVARHPSPAPASLPLPGEPGQSLPWSPLPGDSSGRCGLNLPNDKSPPHGFRRAGGFAFHAGRVGRITAP
jgi:hypothetical protein